MRKLPIIYSLSLCALAMAGAVALLMWGTPTVQAAPAAEPPLTIVKPLTITPVNPSAGQLVTAEFAVRNDGTEPIFLLHLGAAGRAPGCVDFNCPRVVNFAIAEDVTIAPGATYTYQEQRTFLQEGAYFFQLTYEAVIYQWRFVGDRVDVNVVPGLNLSSPLVLTPVEPGLGESVQATFVLSNAGSSPITVRNLVVGARGPNCVPGDWSCTSRPDHPSVDNLTLAPGESYAYSAERSYSQNGRYFVQVSFIDEAGEWQQIGDLISFTVGDPNAQSAVFLYLPAVQR